MAELPVLDDEVIDRALRALAWSHTADHLERTYEGQGFVAAMAFVNLVAWLAERANHHPDIDIRWNRVTLRLSTHSAGGITQADLDLARQIDEVTASN